VNLGHESVSVRGGCKQCHRWFPPFNE
jgi:hypothetical protein